MIATNIERLTAGEHLPINECLDIPEIATMLSDIKSGVLNACACMGPCWGDPYCPCEMGRKGLKSNYVGMPDQEKKHLVDLLNSYKV